MDVDRLQRLGTDPDRALVELARRLEQQEGTVPTQQRLRAVQHAAHVIRELDGGRAAGTLQRTVGELSYPRWGLLRSLRFAREHRMFTRMHVVHALRLGKVRARHAMTRTNVRLHGMSFLGRDVELTADRCAGRIVVGPWCWIGDRAALRSHAGRVTIGAKSIVGGGTVINSYLDVSIGEGVLIADGVHITDFDHRTDRVDVPIKDQGIVVSPVTVESDVWLGRGVTVLRGVTIGRGSVIGAHSVVTRDVPPYSVAVGAPARIVRSRLPGAPV